MDKKEIMALLEKVQAGSLTPEDAALKLKMEPFEELGYAKVDHHRGLRQGTAEVIYGAGKTPQQICGIIGAMRANDFPNEKTIVITRMSPDAVKVVEKQHSIIYDPISKIGRIGDMPQADGKGIIVVATGGTSDMPVAEEAALTAQALGNEVVRVYDVGVAGLHRLLSYMEILMRARVIIAAAGMEGALVSVVGGLVDCPVIALPTSVGYGASFQGLAALLSMLNSCSSGVSVVNIDNGFGAGYLASIINHL